MTDIKFDDHTTFLLSFVLTSSFISRCGKFYWDEVYFFTGCFIICLYAVAERKRLFNTYHITSNYKQ